MMKLRTAILLPIFALFLQTNLSAQISETSERSKEKMEQAFELLMEKYVDNLDDQKLVEDAIKGVLKELDPHSSYIPAEKVDDINEPLRGNFEGIGIQFNILEDTIYVISAISGGPSEKLGILAGDKILFIEEENVAGTGITNSDVVDKLRGPKGTEVNVRIKRKGLKKLLDFTITRDKIPLYSRDAAYMAAPGIGYIKINRFAATTDDELREAMADLESQGMESLILDLQGNGGGYLNTAIEMADEFLSKNKLIVYTEGEHNPRRIAESSSRGHFEEGKLVLLIDEGSASASEIVSGAIQDWDRGLIVGRRSFGKGLVQREYPLPDGSAMRITVARYYTPTGRSIQKPYEEGRDAYAEELKQRYEHGELMHADSIKFPDSLKYYTPNGRVVYGGGGIMPDIFVPVDTSQNSDFYRDLFRKGIFNKFALSYVDRNRENILSTYEDVADYKSHFMVSTIMDEFYDFATREGLELVMDDIATSHTLIEAQVKALIARDVWDTSAYYQIINDHNDSYRKALEMIQNDAFELLKVQK